MSPIKTPVERANELYHHGVKGQKWGIRRFQNSDGTLTDAGKKRYDDSGDNQEAPKKKFPVKTVVTIGATMAATALAAYGSYKLYKFAKKKELSRKIKEGMARAKALKIEDARKAMEALDNIQNHIFPDDAPDYMDVISRLRR